MIHPNIFPMPADAASTHLALLAQAAQALSVPLTPDEIPAAILEAALRLSQAERGFLFLKNTESDEPVFHLARRAGGETLERQPSEAEQSLAREAAQSRQPVTASISLAVPLQTGGTINGALCLSGAAGDRLDLLTILAGQAATLVENLRLQEALKQTQASKNKFVSIVTHELKIPMTPIKGYADLMLQGLIGPLSEQQAQFLNIIRSNVERMAALVNDLADISRIETSRIKLELDVLEIGEFVEAALAPLRPQIEAKGQTLTVHLPADLPKVYADKARLTQVLTNLLSNAHKYTLPEGSITLSAEAISDRPFVRVAVADTGIGISPEDQARLFTQFFRSEAPHVREQTGWGLALHLTQLLVELLGGQITFHSQLGRGSLFAFTLPIALTT